MENPTRRSFQLAALCAFGLSGFAALLYQIVWQRMLVLFSGADVYASTIIVAAFMAGLGIGNLLGGIVADRVSRRTALLGFAGAELAIAAFSLVSRPLYYDVLYQHLGARELGPAVLGGLLFTSLLWPTFFMGVSLPLLAKAITSTAGAASVRVGRLYAVNTLGAAAGAFGTTWLILPLLGLDRGLRVGAVMNVACVLVILPFLTGKAGAAANGDTEASAVAGPAADATLPFAAWIVIYAISGFVALSLEIVWFRLLSVMAKATAFTFGTLLTIYLAGIALGAWLGSIYAPRLKRPTLTVLILMSAIGLLGGALVATLVIGSDRAVWLQQYFGSYEPLGVRAEIRKLGLGQVPVEFLLLYFGLPAVLLLPPTFLMGFCFPILQRIVQTDFARLGRRLGALMLSNIVGSVLGTVVTGVVALDLLGTAGTLKALALVSTIFAFATLGSITRGSARLVILGVVAVVFAGVWRVLPDATGLWARLHGAAAERIIAGEDATGLSVVRLEPSAMGRSTIFVNGVGQSTIPYGDIHTALGMLPAFLHPAPRDVAIIGLGSGDTVYGMAGRPDIARITCVEIIGPQLNGLRGLERLLAYGGLTGLLADPRIEHVTGDGRIFLMRSPATFDIIEADALRPTSAYSGNLYSEEYFTLVKSRLKPGGFAATWLPTDRVHNAFVRVFPYVLSAQGVLVGSSQPINLDRDALARRIADPRVRDHYLRAGIDVAELMSSYLAAPAHYAPDFNREALADVNSDLFPKDEYNILR